MSHMLSGTQCYTKLGKMAVYSTIQLSGDRFSMLCGTVYCVFSCQYSD
jgi:hypothetical protein